jgi:peptidoglycan/LPS O-acetylase OafA/YrhL
MQSKNIGYIEKLDHLRFLAAFTVLEYHADIWFRSIPGTPKEWLPLPLFHRGYTGVALFMVISGMILAAITYGREIDTLRFYLNRVLRIYPLFVFIVALGYFATPDPRETSTGLDFLLALLPISNLYRLHYGAFGGVLFSVAIELQFYLLFPALLLFIRRYGAWYVPALIGFLMLLRTAVYFRIGTAHDIAYFSIFGALDIFLIGMLAGNYYMRETRRQFPAWTVAAAFVGVNLVLLLAHKHRTFFNYDFDGVSSNGVSTSPIWIVWPTVQGLMFAGFALLYLRSSFRLPYASAFAYLGKISYSLYVWHTIVFLAAVKLRLNFLPAYEMGLLVIFPASFLLSVLSYYLIERPFLSMRVVYVRQEQRVEHGLPADPLDADAAAAQRGASLEPSDTR